MQSVIVIYSQMCATRGISLDKEVYLCIIVYNNTEIPIVKENRYAGNFIKNQSAGTEVI